MQQKHVQLALVAGLALAGAAQADPVRTAAESTAACRSLDAPEARLACFDASSLALVTALNRAEAPADPPALQAAPQPAAAAVPERPDWASAPEIAPEPAPARPVQRTPEPDRFEAVIVRITVNAAGRHKFHTEDGDVWEQTIIEPIRAPESLPAVAEFRRRLTGNPTIKFDVSNRTYRVRRVE